MPPLPTHVIITDASGADVHSGRWLAADQRGITVAAPAPIHFRSFRYSDGFAVRFATPGAQRPPVSLTKSYVRPGTTWNLGL